VFNDIHMKDTLQFIKEVGIPAAIAFYVLIRLEPAINANTLAVQQLTILVQQLAGR